MVSVWRGFLFLWVLGMGYVILLWHSLSLPYNYFESAVTRYQNAEKVQFYRRDSRMVEEAQPRLEKKLNPKIK